MDEHVDIEANLQDALAIRGAADAVSFLQRLNVDAPKEIRRVVQEQVERLHAIARQIEDAHKLQWGDAAAA